MATILVIDDHPTNREFLVSLLGYQGHRLLEASDGVEGLAVAQAEQPDLIIVDILMPTIDGFEFVRQLRADPVIAQTRVIFNTAAYNAHEIQALAENCGVTGILTKPAKPQVVLKAVNAALRLAEPPLAPPPVEEFDREHLRLLTDKLSQKVVELEAISLRLATLVELGQELALERDLSSILETACSAAREIIGAKYAAIDILDEKEPAQRQFLTSGLDSAIVASIGPPPAGHSLLGQLMQTSHPIRLRDLSADPRTGGFPPHHPPMHSFLGVPLASPTRLYGRLYVADKLGMDEFSAEDERLAVTLAAQVALTYENTLRYAEIQRHTAELEQLVNERTAELQRSNAELEQFAYVASHDLQEPLRMVSRYCQHLERRYKGQLDAKADKYIAYAVDGARRMQELINDLLDYSRVKTQGKAFEPTDCQQVFAQACANLRRTIQKSQAQVSCEPLPTVLADAAQLVSLFQNLIGNAIKYQCDASVQVHISAERQDGEWLFAVRDNGIGIKPEYFERIFLIFQRLHERGAYPGTGIGLAICQKIVEHHGGRIWVESELGEGSTFYFTLKCDGGREKN
ncbi:MAG: response regulator [Chloroflexi bacterium]|nr:response regulator [Chloroflexota bacterium]